MGRERRKGRRRGEKKKERREKKEGVGARGIQPQEEATIPSLLLPPSFPPSVPHSSTPGFLLLFLPSFPPPPPAASFTRTLAVLESSDVYR